MEIEFIIYFHEKTTTYITLLTYDWVWTGWQARDWICKFPIDCGSHDVHSQAKQDPFLSINSVSKGRGQRLRIFRFLLVFMLYQSKSL